MDAARARALEVIVSQLEARVQSEVSLTSDSVTGSRGADWAERITENIVISAESDLPGAEVVDSWEDSREDITYVLVSVDRSHLLDRLLPGVEQANLSAAELLASNADPEADPARALIMAMTAYGLVAATFGDAAKAKVVADGSPGATRTQSAFDRSAALKNKAAERLATLASSIHIAKLSGDNQSGVARGALPQPLEAGFSYRRADQSEVPLSGLPVRFRAESQPGPALAASSTTTDANGRVRCTVADIASTGQASNRIVVEPDLAQLAPGAQVAMPVSEAFVYSLPTPGQTPVAVSVQTRFDGRPLDLDFVSGDVASHLSSRGFEAEVRPQLVGLGLDALRSRLGQSFRYVVRGEATAWLGNREGGAAGLQYVLAKAKLDVVDLVSGDVFTITSAEAKSAYAPDQVTDSEAGAVKALRALRSKLQTALDTEFVSLFGPIGDDGP